MEGIVSRVAPSGAFVVVGGLHVPLECVLAVHWPSRLGDSTHKGATGWRGPGHRWEPQDTALWHGDVPA